MRKRQNGSQLRRGPERKPMNVTVGQPRTAMFQHAKKMRGSGERSRDTEIECVWRSPDAGNQHGRNAGRDSKKRNIMAQHTRHGEQLQLRE